MAQPVVSNGVVIDDRNGQVTYHPRCPYCGYIDTMSKRSMYIATPHGVTNCPSWKCPSCYKSSETKGVR